MCERKCVQLPIKCIVLISPLSTLVPSENSLNSAFRLFLFLPENLRINAFSLNFPSEVQIFEFITLIIPFNQRMKIA